MNIEIQLLNETAKIPEYATDGSSGFDLVADNFKLNFAKDCWWPDADLVHTVKIRPGGRLLVGCGFKVAIKEGFEMQVRSRSGLALKQGIAVLNSPGTIDSDYRGEIGVVLVNHSFDEVVINKGDRIAQGVIQPVFKVNFINKTSLDETQRGAGGFGSTGHNYEEKRNNQAY